MKSTTSTTPTHDEISKRAHDTWEQSGRPEGQETAHWLQAERELRQARDQTGDAGKGSSESVSPFAGSKRSRSRRDK